MRKLFCILFLLPIAIFAASGTMKGAGTEADPWQIEDYEDLKALSSGAYLYSDHYVLTADIDASPSFDSSSPANWFYPIGYLKDSLGTNIFTGSIDGRNHTICNMFIMVTHVGEIGFITKMKGGTLSNLHFDSLTVITDLYESTEVGGVVANDRKSKIKNVSVKKGFVLGTTDVGGLLGYSISSECDSLSFQGKVVGRNYVGGLAGELYSGVSNSFTDVDIVAHGDYVGGFAGKTGTQYGLTNVYSNGTITLAETFYEYEVGAIFTVENKNRSQIGGLVGYNVADIYYSHSSVNINARGRTFVSENVGGLVGINKNHIWNSYATGNVSGNENVGGLVGKSIGDIADAYAWGSVIADTNAAGLVADNGGKIRYAYSLGSVTASRNEHALANGDVDSSYWNVETSGIASSENGVGLTSEQMTHMSSFEGWENSKISVIGEICTSEDEILTEIWDGESIRYCEKSIWSNVDGKTFPSFTLFFVQDLPLVAEPTISDKWTEEPIVSAVNDNGVVPFGRWTNSITENAAGDSIYYGYQIGYAAGKDTVWGTFSYVAIPNALTISSYDELQKIGHHVGYPLSGHYTLTADIDGTGKEFDPIGSVSEPFTGTFDGKNHVIRNLTINKPLRDNVGLFSALSYAKLTNLIFENAKVNGSWLVGVAAGRAQNSYIKNVVSYNGTVVGDTYVGGVFGHLNQNDVVAEVGGTGTVAGVEKVGGVSGELFLGALIRAFSASQVSGVEDVGGIVGFDWNGRIHESYSASIVKGRVSKALGGISGHAEIMTHRDTMCYYDSTVLGFSRDNFARTTTQMLSKSNYENWDFENVWEIEEGVSYPYLKGAKPILPGQVKDDGAAYVLEGKGTALQPYLISSYSDLKYIGHYEYTTDLYYKLTNNIVAGGPDDEFEPIKDFSGVFLGNGKTISKLVIDQGSQDTVGLFKTLMTGATVSNLHLDTIKVSGRNYVGGLAGVDFGANIDSVDVLVQMNAENYAGAIAGEKSSGRLSLSSAVGSIVAKEYAGGLFGNLKNAKVNDALSFVYVSGDKYLGGLVGNASNTDVSNSFTAGKVVGSKDVGVIVGASDKSTWTSVYGDSTVWNFSKNAGGNLKNTPQLVHQETYENMDFDKTWKIAEGRGYPYLKWSSRSNNVFGDSITVLDGSGTDEDPYIIRTPQDLRSIGYSIYTLDRVYRLVNDITMSTETNDRAYKESIGHQGKVTSKWLPDLSIASGKTFNTKFSGKFLGGGHTITGLCAVYDFSPGGHSVGFIDTLAETGIIDSLSLVNFKTTNNAQWSSAVVVNYGTIKNVSIDGALLGVNVGGVAGNNYGTIQDCYVTGNVVADSVAGGIAAENWGTIDNCVVENINARGYKAVGGIAGIEHKTTTNTKVSGEVFSIESYAGGAFGIIDGASVSNVTAACSVQVADPTKTGIMGGGFVGLNNGTISKSSAVGNLRNASGFVGTNMSIIEDCFATGDVKDASGFVSYNHGTISRSYSTGNIEWMTFPSNVLGGFAMQNFSDGTITDVYSTGSIALNNFGSVTANILVAVQSGTLKNAFATGSVDIAGQSAFCGNRSWENAGENVYFNSDKCQLPDSVKNMTALSESQMLHSQNFEGFDFKKVWTIDEGVSYPIIRLERDTTTEETPEEIPEKPLYVYDSGIEASAMKVLVHGNVANVLFRVNQAGNVKLDLLDVRGRFVVSKKFGALAVGDYYKTLDLSALTKGRYIVVLRVNERMVERKFISR